jgi:hypothetical protein
MNDMQQKGQGNPKKTRIARIRDSDNLLSHQRHGRRLGNRRSSLELADPLFQDDSQVPMDPFRHFSPSDILLGVWGARAPWALVNS